MTTHAPDALLAEARAGDEHAFAALTAPHRRELHVHCYRMLGSYDDADDLLQETLVAAWQGLPSYAGRSTLRTWLYRIATHRCLNAIRDGRRRPPTAPQPPFDAPPPSDRLDVTWLQPYPDALTQTLDREGVELAFVTALQRLPPRQTAALLLVDVLGFAPAEAADLLGTGRAATKGLLQRARATAPRPADAAGTDPEEAALARRLAAAFSADDVDAVVDLLTDEAWLAMPPAPHRYRGRAAVASFLRASAEARSGRRFHLVETRANHHPAYGCFLDGEPVGLLVVTADATGATSLTRFLGEACCGPFDLPPLAEPSRTGDR